MVMKLCQEVNIPDIRIVERQHVDVLRGQLNVGVNAPNAALKVATRFSK